MQNLPLVLKISAAFLCLLLPNCLCLASSKVSQKPKFAIAPFSECGNLDISPNEWPMVAKPSEERSSCDDSYGENSARITGGMTASRSSFPSYVAIIERVDSDKGIVRKFTCGGTLIGKNLVLTAKHCLDRKPLRNITFIGSLRKKDQLLDTQPDGSVNPHLLVTCSSKNDDIYISNDVAIVGISSTFTNPAIRPACLPYIPKAYNEKNMHLIGMGTIDKKKNLHHHAQFLPIKHANGTKCLKPGLKAPPTENQEVDYWCGISVGGGTPCRGDSGSGAFILNPKNNKHTIVGLLGHTADCMLSKSKDSKVFYMEDIVSLARSERMDELVNCINLVANGEKQNEGCDCRTLDRGFPQAEIEDDTV